MAEGLKNNTTLTSLEYAAQFRTTFGVCHGPMTFCTFSAPGSLAENHLCGVNEHGYGTYTVEAINKLSEAITTSTTLTSLKCV